MMKYLNFEAFKIILMIITSTLICIYSFQSYKQSLEIQKLIDIKTEDRYKGADAKRDFTIRDQAIENLAKRIKELESQNASTK